MAQWTRWVSALTMGLSLASATLAQGQGSADGVRGTAVVLAKDVAHRTLTLDGERVFQVTPQTRLAGPDGERITLDQVPSAVAEFGGYRVMGHELVEFEAVTRGQTLELTELRVVNAKSRK